MNRLSTFKAQSIFEVYCMMKDCASVGYIEDSDYICSMLEKISRYKLILPSELYRAIADFVKDVFYPIIDDPEYFASVQNSKFGRVENGAFIINSEESFYQMLAVLFEIVEGVDKQIEDFAEETLRPYI